MILRRYKPSDAPFLVSLFYDTVHTVCAQDYTEAQRNAWAPGDPDPEQWNQSFLAHYTVVALEGALITGFGDIDSTGYLDRLFVRSGYQRQGIGAALCDLLERQASGSIVTHASLTARPFFEARGYRVIRAQEVERKGILLKNFVMEKQLG